MKRLRVAMLVHEDLVPPESIEGLTHEQILPFQAEYDVAQAIEALGHELRIIGVASELTPIRETVQEWKPDVVFNLLMEFRDEGAFQVHVASYLELLDVPFTGCNPRGILLSRDKEVCKKILRYQRIRTPAFAVFELGRQVRPTRKLSFPLIVKTVDEEASLGIAQASVVRSEEQLRERVAFIHESVGTDALVEQYIHGRELTMGLLGNRRVTSFPVWEMVFEKLPDGSVPIATERAKWDRRYQERVGIDTGPAKDLPDGMAERIARVSRRVYRALGLSGYARMDFRLAEDGQLFVIEANATPDIARGEDYAESARATGIDYEPLIQRILNLGLRFRPRRRTTG